MLSKEEAAAKAKKTRMQLGVILRRSLELNRNREVTCEHCQFNDNCEYAFDVYNTDGDCLMEK